MFLACTASSCWAQSSPQAAEYQVKAAFLFKFLGFVEWPPQAFVDADSPLVIGVLGADALAEELVAAVAGRIVHGHPVAVRKVRPRESVAGLHMLFVGRPDSGSVVDLLDSAKGQPLLTVTESDEAFADGSAINFVVVENKVRFDVALGPAAQSHLKISSRLLAVARRVLPSSS